VVFPDPFHPDEDDKAPSYDRFCPHSFSLSPKTRSTWASLDAEDPERQAAFMAEVPVFTCPDARRACGFIPFRDTTGDILSSVMADHLLVTSQLCIPDLEQETSDEGPQFAPDTARTTGWGSHPQPPSPLSFLAWADDLDLPAPPASSHVFTCHNPIYSTSDHRLQQHTVSDPSRLGAWILLPQFLLPPLGHGLPVGLVLDPQKLTVDHLHTIVSSFTPTNESCRVDWIKNPLMQSWLTAVALQPNDFILHLEDQVDFLDSLSDTLEDDEPVLDINRHIQWTLTHHHLFIDALLAGANKQMNTKFTRFLQHCLADTAAIGASPLVGPIDDIFLLGVCLCFRHPTVV